MHAFTQPSFVNPLSTTLGITFEQLLSYPQNFTNHKVVHIEVLSYRTLKHRVKQLPS